MIIQFQNANKNLNLCGILPIKKALQPKLQDPFDERHILFPKFPLERAEEW